MKLRTLAFTLALAACASAVREPSPISAYAPGHVYGRTVAQLIAEADQAWSLRGQPGQAKLAQDLYLDAAVEDPAGIVGLLGAMRVLSFRIEYERGVSRGELARIQVELGQWCQRRAPAEAACDYRLAIALGQQARERTSTGKDAMNRMVTLLKRAIARDPQLDSGGPDRVLALLLLRAPSWPVGPGDVEAALDHARAAVAIAPSSSENYLVLGEALTANGHTREARDAYLRAAALADASRAPEARHWRAQARTALGT